jgi:hypothetical protein
MPRSTRDLFCESAGFEGTWRIVVPADGIAAVVPLHDVTERRRRHDRHVFPF